MKTYHLKISLDGIEPEITREIKINSQCTLYELHAVIQISMGWFSCHLHEFEKGGERYGTNDPDGWGEPVIDEKTVSLSDIFKRRGSKINYLYDFGDDWLHTVKLVDIDDEPIIYPACIEGKRACPPEDVGGVYGYMNFLEIMSDPDDPEYEEMLEWSGVEEPFDPDRFDLESVNKTIVEIFGRKTKQ